jgi:hypothetical protein
MEKFKHHPLYSSNCTRVLLLHPSPDPSGPLIGDLRERPLAPSSSSLTADEQYEALSYVWGTPSKEHGIIIHDKWLDITANCDAALRHLRQELTPRVMWVDAICIDQEASAVAERSAQVAMMGDIYHVASSTILWLGPGGAEAETVGI